MTEAAVIEALMARLGEMWTVTLAGICEPYALQGARDITAFGGWRAYLASLQTAKN